MEPLAILLSEQTTLAKSLIMTEHPNGRMLNPYKLLIYFVPFVFFVDKKGF